jgi:hypothetical protein
LLDTPKASVLWCARPVGPVDSPEWSVIERFISDWRPEELPCLPCLLRTPAGCRCLVSMRLDCDEDVASARDIFEWYAGEGIPLSLAVKTSLPLRREDIALMEDVAAHGGTILSHSHEHRLNWGDSYKEAREDAARSGRRLAEVCPRLPVPDLAVSPFHSNPPYAVRALAAAGFQGFVSGIIHNDPEYLLGRAGVVPFARGIVGVSQQSMLHGDCYRRQQESVEAHVQAFESQYAAGGIFGYLDHPFSARYQYDWQDAGQRLGAHHKLVAALRGYAGVWFCSQRQCFDFVRTLSAIRLTVGRDGKIRVQAPQRRQPLPVYRYRGMETACRPDAG